MGIGVSPFWSQLICAIIPLSLILIAALVGYRLEGNTFSWTVFKERFRLNPFPLKAWLWILGGILVSIAGAVLLGFTQSWIISIPGFAPPSFLAGTLDVTKGRAVVTWANSWMIAVFLFQILFNVFCEELWWRGYILPRQELNYGKGAWAVNGLLWALFHVPILPWNTLAIMPLYLSVPFVTQRFKNTRTGMIIHFVLLLPQLLAL